LRVIGNISNSVRRIIEKPEPSGVDRRILAGVISKKGYQDKDERRKELLNLLTGFFRKVSKD
jgi:hypothetical protein